MADKTHVTHTASIKLLDGTTAAHTAEAITYRHLSDGAVSVLARCCADPSTDAWHSFYDVANLTDDAITKEVASHVQRKAEHHASVHRAGDFMKTLLKGEGDAVQR